MKNFCKIHCKTCFVKWNSGDNQAHILPCGHSLCLECCNKIKIMESPNQCLLKCPFCREPYYYVYEGNKIKNLTKNYEVMNIVDATKSNC